MSLKRKEKIGNKKGRTMNAMDEYDVLHFVLKLIIRILLIISIFVRS